MPCGNVWVNSFATGIPSRFEYMCWGSGDDDSGGGGGGDTYNPPSGGGSSSSGVSSGGVPTTPGFNPGGTSGTVVVGTGGSSGGTSGGSSAPTINPNLGWNSGAYSIESVPSDWVGYIICDIPDVQGSRPGGVAVGLALTSSLPVAGRSGYGHLLYGLVFTSTEVRVISGGEQKALFDYGDLRAARSGATDVVRWVMYGDQFAAYVNDVLIDSGPFDMPGEYSLDATLYTAYDAVDNPVFNEGGWPEESLIGSLPAFEMDGASPAFADIVASMSALDARLSELSQADIVGALPRFTMTAGDLGDGGITGSLGRLQMLAYSGSAYGEVQGSLRALQMTGGMEEPDDLSYSMLTASMPRMFMTAEAPRTGRLDAALPGFFMRASAEASYSELIASMPSMRAIAYGAGLTPLVQVPETVGAYHVTTPAAYLSVAILERIDGTSTAVLSLTMAADAMEQISAQDEISALQTYMASTMEQIGMLQRLRVAVLRDAGGAPGSAVDESEAWAVNTANSASTRYDSYGFNSFASFGGKHYGAKPDGVYLLEGANDAGEPIASGVSFGQHDFGTQALKHISAVHVGVSSTGALFLKVGDGVNSYTYRARRTDPRMKVQRFDTGRGLRANYFTFDLTSDKDAFELDSVQFEVLASQRRI